ncbi:raffinose/stachyose/melibiose transport system permease protein [Streptacidiphilus sp. MAP12-20]|uniref:carbohydrate ABC transporter permease n=1 Tax=Streptacidiphilus sp. MAP12-20 TaxID=3156299 RepID=UPI003512E677
MTSHLDTPPPGAPPAGARPAAPDPDPAAARRAAAARSRARRRALLPAALFLAPLLALYGVYYLYAFVFLGQTSTQNVDLSFTGATDVGFRNFQLVLTDPVFWRDIGNNLLFAAVSIAVSLTLGFFLAVSLASGVRARKFFFVVFLLPSLIPMSLFATVFGQLIQTNGGAINQTLRAVGLGALAQDWTGNTGSAYVAVFILLTYLIGLPVMYYTSDLTTANTAVLEAAMIDGAGTWQMYRMILFPMLRSTHKTVILSVLLGSFRWFEVIFFSTGSQPAGRTGIPGTYIYDQMFPSTGGGQIGYASAASLVVLVVAIAVSAVNVLVQRRR